MAKSKDPGLGSKFNHPIDRLLNPQGTYNIKRIGIRSHFSDFYTFMLHTSWIKFSSILFISYCLANISFAAIYLLVDENGISGKEGIMSDYMTSFYFSCQTFTTVGYGSLYPTSNVTNIIASFEAFIGLMSTALATGLLYGRFSKPHVKVGFSDKIICNWQDDEPKVLFKLVNKRKNVLLRTSISCILILDSNDPQNPYFKTYHQLPLEISSILFFALSWTIVHKIDESSPFRDMTLAELRHRNAELIIYLESYDESFGKTVVQKHSYAGDQWIENFKFSPNFGSNKKGKIELYIDQLNNIYPN